MAFDSNDQSLDLSLKNSTDLGSSLTPSSRDIITPDLSQTSFGSGSSEPQEIFPATGYTTDRLNSIVLNSLGGDSSIAEWHSELDSSDRRDILSGGLETVSSRVEEFLNDEDASQKISEIFDAGNNTSTIISLLEEIAQGDWGNLSTIQIASDDILEDAHGAYESSTDTIFISESLLLERSADFEWLPSVLLEEIGHSLDARTSSTDSTGDEGFIFAATVQGIDISDSVLMALRAENDSTTIVIDGQSYVVEGGQSQIAMTTLNGKLYQTIRDESNHLQIRSSNNGYYWSQWQQLGNDTFKTHNAPEIESFDNKIYLSYRSAENQIIVGTIDPQEIDGLGAVDVDGNQQFGGATPDSISMKATEDELYIFHRGLNNEIYYKTISKQSSDKPWLINEEDRWIHLDTPSGGTSTPDSIAVESHRGELYLAHRSESGDMYVGKLNESGKISSWHKINGQTKKGISLSSVNRHLYITHVGTDRAGTIYSGTYVDGSNVNWIKQARTTPSEVSLEEFRGRIFEAHHSQRGDIYTFQTNGWGRPNYWRRTNKETGTNTLNDGYTPYRNRSADSFAVGGDIWEAFQSASGENGLLRTPTSEAYEIEGGLRQDFKGGAIVQSDYGTFTLYGGIGKKYADLGAEDSYLGLPTSGEYIEAKGRTRQDFEGGYMLWKAGYQVSAYDTRAVNSLPPDSGSGSTSTWQVDYWNRPDMVGIPTSSIEVGSGDIRFAAGLGSPAGTLGIGENNFSSRWSTQSYFEGGLYDFISRADDGVRVYLNGVKIIDKWSATAPFSRDDGYVLVPEGEHDVVVEYFEAGGGAALNFTWERNSLLLGWTGELLPVGADGNQVHNTYVNTFENNGGIEQLGHPVNRVHAWASGFTQDFTGGQAGTGAIMKSNANDNSFWVGDDIWLAFLRASGANGLLQYPTSEAYEIEGGQRQDFQGGAIIQSDYGTFTLYGGIGGKYFSLNAEDSFLGLPKSDEYLDEGGRTRQDFDGGYILWKAGYPTIAYDTRAIESLPADSGQGSTSNWHVQYWNGTDMSGSPEWSGYASEGELRFAAGFGAPVGTWGIKEDEFSARWSTTSYFEGGLYDFISRADDGVRVYVNGTKVIDKWQAAHPFGERSNYIALENGYHQVMVEYFEQGGGAAQTLQWKQVTTVEQWTGEFFNGREITNASAGFSIESADELNKQWDAGVAPVLLTSSQSGLNRVSIGSDNFIDRWTTTRYFEEGGLYELISQADDGVRVFVDGELLIDKWQDQPFTVNKAHVSLSDGYHHIKVEHYENAGVAANNLKWEKVQPRDIGSRSSQDSLWAVEYFNNRDLAGQPVKRSAEIGSTQGVHRKWGLGSPTSGVNVDNFSSRWTTQAKFQEGGYSFKVGSDDGVRLLINGETILDRWRDRGFADDTVSVWMPAGEHTVELEYYEHGGAAEVLLDWKLAVLPSHRGAQDDFLDVYEKLALSSGQRSVGVPISRFETVTTDVLSTLGNRSTGEMQQVRGSDGIGAVFVFAGYDAAFVSGRLLPAYQQLGGVESLGFPVTSERSLENGAVELDLPDGKLFWAPGMSNPTYYQYVNGSMSIPADSWRGEYFNNMDWSGDPILVTSDSQPGANLDINWNAGSPLGIQTDQFSSRWTRQQPFDRGTYRLVGTHDDDFIVSVNGQSPIDKRVGAAGSTSGLAVIASAGQYTVEVKHREHFGHASASLQVEKISNFGIGLEATDLTNDAIDFDFYDAWLSYEMGTPTSAVETSANGVQYQYFDKPNVKGKAALVKSDHGTFSLYGGIRTYYKEETGGLNGKLGVPTSG